MPGRQNNDTFTRKQAQLTGGGGGGWEFQEIVTWGLPLPGDSDYSSHFASSPPPIPL